MRLIAFIAAALVASSPVAAQEWQRSPRPVHKSGRLVDRVVSAVPIRSGSQPTRMIGDVR
jgi:hypothetical protein